MGFAVLCGTLLSLGPRWARPARYGSDAARPGCSVGLDRWCCGGGGGSRPGCGGDPKPNPNPRWRPLDSWGEFQWCRKVGRWCGGGVLFFAFLKGKKEDIFVIFFCSCLGVCFPTHVLFCCSSDKKRFFFFCTYEIGFVFTCTEKKFEPPFLSPFRKIFA